MENQTNQMPVQKNNSYALPMAIIIAGLLIGGAVIYSNKEKTVPVETQTVKEVKEPVIKAIDENDHILGSRNAEIILIEYSDIECPYCKDFHVTLHKIVEKFSKEGKLSWVYRHFPLEIHPKAIKEAEATECAAELGGNQKFWQYIDRLYQITPSNNGLDLLKLNDIASEVSLNSKSFNDCLESGKYSEKIENSISEAQEAGGRGTPHVILILKDKLDKDDQLKITNAAKAELKKLSPNYNTSEEIIYFFQDGKKIVFTGAFPYEMVNAIVENIL